MGKELYVGHLSYDTSEWELEKLFSVSGRVTSIHLITDPVTGEFKGCGYVRMSTEAEAKDAIQSLDGALFLERKITVSEARPQNQLKPGGYKGKAPAGGRGGAPKSGGKTGGFNAAGSKPAGAKPSGAKPAGFKAGPVGGKPRSGKR